ncbi:hypothetical protein [Ideonella sp. BN130291]|uniref:hypothetical protein n=1 Tax=Ideonella sp. BN130291 TaxID=3112940 RepID=UPI002E2742D4|nr:hypothetical protein [Ideonella sp. BN130291]
MIRWPLRALRSGLRWAIALVLLFEEWGWEPLSRALGQLERLPVFAWLGRRIRNLPPYAALGIFLLPTLALLPIKLAALWLIGKGHAGMGLLVIVAAKIAGTAIVARLFVLTRESLMRLAWFARWYGRWMTWKDTLLAHVRASVAWQRARRIKAGVRRFLRRRVRV